jgi:hypothetical protein
MIGNGKHRGAAPPSMRRHLISHSSGTTKQDHGRASLLVCVNFGPRMIAAAAD